MIFEIGDKVKLQNKKKSAIIGGDMDIFKSQQGDAEYGTLQKSIIHLGNEWVLIRWEKGSNIVEDYYPIKDIEHCMEIQATIK